MTQAEADRIVARVLCSSVSPSDVNAQHGSWDLRRIPNYFLMTEGFPNPSLLSS